MASAQKHTLVVIRHAPYGSGLARAGVDAALAMAAFEQPVTVLFLGDGVLQLFPSQDSRRIGLKNIGRLLASFPLYGIEQVYADSGALRRYGMDPQAAPVTTVSLADDAIRALLCDHDRLLGF